MTESELTSKANQYHGPDSREGSDDDMDARMSWRLAASVILRLLGS